MNDPLTTARRTLAVRPRHLLARILEAPELATQIQELPPPALARLIDHVGLEDCGEIVALATTQQLAHVFDEDLWRSERSGEDERFDAARFLLWLEVMLEAGDGFVAQRLAELPEELVTLAFHKHVLVLDLDALHEEMFAMDEDERDSIDKALESGLSEEFDEYRVIARQADGWDAVVSALVALDRDHHRVFTRILERCCRMSTEYIDDNGGLYDVLTSEESLEDDVAGEREERRAGAGYVAPSSATAFLELAKNAVDLDRSTRDPLSRAYFARLDRTPPARVADIVPGVPGPNALHDLLVGSGVLDERSSPALLPAATARSEAPLFARALRELDAEAPHLFATRSEELAYVANVLVAGWSSRARRPASANTQQTCSSGWHGVAATRSSSWPPPRRRIHLEVGSA